MRAGDGGHDQPPAGGRAGEADLIDEAGADRLVGGLVGHVQELEDALRQVRLVEAVGEVLGDQRGLAGMLHDHRVAGKDRRQHGIERGHVGEIPRRQIEHDAQRLAADIALEALLRPDVDVGEHLRRHRQHVAGALLEAAHLARPVADGPAHLPGEQFRHARRIGDHGVGEGGADPDALGDRHVAPFALRRAGALERGARGLVVGQRPLGIDRAIDGGNDLEGGVHRVLHHPAAA